jgi:hypothetical protein
VFAGTYCTANCTETICKFFDLPVDYPKFLATSLVNVTLSVRKDALYAVMYRPASSARKPVGWSTLGLFGIRDAMTIVSSFILPHPLAKRLSSYTNTSYEMSYFICQLMTPVSIQLLSTPINLMGLNIYNKPTSTMTEHLQFIRKVRIVVCVLVICISEAHQVCLVCVGVWKDGASAHWQNSSSFRDRWRDQHQSSTCIPARDEQYITSMKK